MTLLVAAALSTAIASGETFTYHVRLGPADKGAAALAAGVPGARAGRRVLPIRAAGEPNAVIGALFGARLELLSYLDLHTGAPARTVVESTRGGATRRYQADWPARGGRVQVRVRKGAERARTAPRRLPPGAHDPLTALWSLRGGPLPVGATRRGTVLFGTRVWEVEATVAARERIVLPVGEIEALRLDGSARRDGRAEPLRFSLWLSADAARLPLRVEGRTLLGPARVELTGYRRSP